PRHHGSGRAGGAAPQRAGPVRGRGRGAGLRRGMRLPTAQLSARRVDEGAAEALVLGAGPAGSAAAAVLAQEGRRVVLVRPSRTPEGALGESVPPSARKLLAEIGALEAVEAAGFVSN